MSALSYGYYGDEDNGQTSAWYVFSAMGFYPVCPGTNQYVIGSPLFKKVTLYFENGKQFVISAPQNSVRNIYIQSALLRGLKYDKIFLDHWDIIKGGDVESKISSKPNLKRSIAEDSFPYSFSN